MGALGLALRQLGRDMRSGELTLLVLSLIIAVASVTTVAIFTDRLGRALERDSATFLAADRVIEARAPIPDAILDEANALKLERAETLSFLTMAFSEDAARLSSVKAVSDRYPLRGALGIAAEPFVAGAPTAAIPSPGEVWVEGRLLPLLGVEVGGALDIGFATFTIGAVLTDEPDRGGGFTNNAGPRVLMNLADVAATEVVQPGSQLRYRYLFSGDDGALVDFRAAVAPLLPDGTRLIDIRESSEDIGDALDRAERFLLLGGLLGVVLAGVGIALAARRYSVRHYDHVAILKTLGATPGTVDRMFVTLFVAIGIVAAAVGTAAGWVVQVALIAALGEQVPADLPLPGLEPLLVGTITGFVCLLAFALPPLVALRNVQPIRVIRRDLGEARGRAGAVVAAAGVAGILALMWWYSRDLVLTLVTFGGAAAVVGVFASAAWLLLRSGRAVGTQAGSAWRLAFAGIRQRGGQSTTQVLVFGLAIMLLLLLWVVRTTLVADWQAQVPAGAPNHFALNVTERDLTPLTGLLADNDITPQPAFALLPATLTDVISANGAPWEPPDDDGRVPGLSRNVTALADLPDDNAVTEGAWWPAGYEGPPLVSVEAEFADWAGIGLGDTLTLAVRGEPFAAEVSSIRTVVWETLRPNFGMIFSPGALDAFASTYVTSFYLPPSQKLVLNDIVRALPTVTVIEVDAILEQIEAIIARVTVATELVLYLILASGAVVLVASIQASMDERVRQQAILRTLGASRRLVLGSLAIEFLALGIFAGLLAAAGAEVTAYLLETQVFDLPWAPNAFIWPLGPLIGGAVVGAVGLAATVRLVRTPPTTILREII